MSQISGHHYGRAFRAFLWAWCALGLAALLFIGVHLCIQDASLSDRLLPLVAGSLIVLGVVVYSIPSILACISEHPRRTTLYWVNWILGWTIAGWVAALIWACVGFRARRKALKNAVPVVAEKAEEPAVIDPVDPPVSTHPETAVSLRVHTQEEAAEFYRCPKCSENIRPTAIVCHFCQFEVGKYRDNLNSAKITNMVRSNKDHRMLWLKDKYKKESSSHSFMWIVYVLMGIVLSFVPIIGWFMAPVMFFWAFVTVIITLIAPVRGAIFLNYFIDRDTYKADRTLAEKRSQNTYVEANCPVCGFGIASVKDNRLYSWPDEKIRYVNCPGCERVSTRIDDMLLWIPYPSISLKGGFREYFPAE